MRVLRRSEVEALCTMEGIVASVEEAFGSLARGEAQLPAVLGMTFDEADGEVHAKGAHLLGSPEFVIKVSTGFYRNPALGLPSSGGCVLVFSATNGQLEWLLLDNGLITDLRTGAAGAVAAKHLARKRLSKVAIIGAGIQARQQLRALAVVRQVPAVEVWSLQGAEAYADEMSAAGFKVTPVRTAREAVVGADLIITVTPSKKPIVQAEWLVPGVHVNAVGADMPGKQELDAEVLARADVVIADRLEQCLQWGEIHNSIAAGAISPADVDGELGDVVIGRIPGRTDEGQITVCDLTGVGVQDAAAASSIVSEARKQAEMGLELDL